MRAGGASTAHYRAVITDLQAEREPLAAAVQSDREALKSKEQALADLDRAIAQLVHRLDAQSEPKAVDQPQEQPAVPRGPLAPNLAGLGLGDACIAAIASLGGRATNHEIVGQLSANGYEMKSDNPLNNVGTGLNHRSKNRGDVIRDGRHWVLKKSESPAVNGASHMNGAAVQPA